MLHVNVVLDDAKAGPATAETPVTPDGTAIAH
jgi:hypothetical protein